MKPYEIPCELGPLDQPYAGGTRLPLAQEPSQD